MERFAALHQAGRGPGYTRGVLRKDVLYNYFRFRDVSFNVSKKLLAATHISDSFVQQMTAWGIIDENTRAVYDRAALDALSHMDQLDHLSAEALYHYIHSIRKAVLGVEAVEAAQDHLAREGMEFIPRGIDQTEKKAQLLTGCDTVLFAITQPELLGVMAEDLRQARSIGKQVRILCGQPGDGLMSKRLLAQWLDAEGADCCESLPRLPENSCLLVYGEEGFTACRSLGLDAVVHGVPTGHAAQAVTGLWGGEGCTVYIPQGFDITAHVPLTSKTRLSYSHLAQLWQAYGDGIYSLSAEVLYRRYPQYFWNVYDLAPSGLPICPVFREGEDIFSQFDRQLDEGLKAYLGSFENVQFHSAYFDENLECRPICYDPSQKQPGILVQAARVQQAAGAAILRCEKGVTPRQMFRRQALPGVGLVSNFLFFLTPKLGILYNNLRADRPMEQADAASGHLDYMLEYREGRRIETFPLFRKTCIAMTDEGRFLFCNFRLGGGHVDISGTEYTWDDSCVDSDTAPLRLYTPYYSLPDKDADRDTYRKTVGEGRVNVVILGQRVTCVRKGDVILPSVGVVLSLAEADAAPLLKKLKPLSGGYYDVSGLTLTVSLDPPKDIDPRQWETVRWAYGGGLTLIQNGVGLCDGDHMQQWFDTEGWSSPLSRQTQESNLHSLVKHPRTAIGCTQSGALVVLVYSGRTWRSTGADYREMIEIARQLFPDIQYLMNCDGGGSAMLGFVQDGSFMELSCPSTSAGSCAGQVRPINTVFYIPAGERKEL